MAVRVICIKKLDAKVENPYLQIEHLEWINERINVKGITDRSKIYDWIKLEKGEAYIIDAAGKKAILMPEISADGNKYVKTSDDINAEALFLLPECS